MTEQEQIDALKAQVNCLREELKILSIGLGFSLCHADGVIKRTDIKNLISNVDKILELTPEQCLDEVKAKAIEDSMLKIINACVKYSVEKYISTSVEMVSVGQLKHLSEIRHHGEWKQAK